MAEKIFVHGNEAVCWGALEADCEAYFAYPITPQNEIPEWMSREFPKRGKVFVQAMSETGAINMVYGAAAAGVRVMTSTSGPGWGLMQETMSHLADNELPAVIVVVQRGGPGQGHTQHSQMDYMQVTRGGGQGGYRAMSLAPASVQEVHDLVQLAFHLSDKYLIPVIVLSDAMTGHIMESLDLRTLDFGPRPERQWAVKGKAHQKDGNRQIILSHNLVRMVKPYDTYINFLEHLQQKWQEIEENEVRYESYRTDDAEIVLVAFGYMGRICKEAVEMAREQGLKVGLIRPITLWPFPSKPIRAKAAEGADFLVVEDNLGQMIDDVRLAVAERGSVDLLGVLSRDTPMEGGRIFPDRVLEEIVKLSKRKTAS
ncbi:3-methyl-2-oxobutanoate dehydrogenase subunit VorB [Chloroflexota bacterium]